MKKLFLLLSFLSLCFCCVTSSNVISTSVYAAQYTQAQALHILVPTEAEALKIREMIVSGDNQSEIFKNFMNAAKKYSKCPSGTSGGILGWFYKGDMVPEFDKAVFELPNGQVSQPVKTQFGWHLIYVISKK